MILRRLGIFGWKEADENLVLASLLTGERGRGPAARPARLHCRRTPSLSRSIGTAAIE
jgi:hypothetical protein